jgi:regulator of nucleoside diphosphate kinase
MSGKKRKVKAELPSILIRTEEMRRLSLLADSGKTLLPCVAHSLACKIDRANVVPDNADLPGVVRMGSRVKYRDEGTSEGREVVLVYPHQADISRGRISVLTPVGVALIGLTVGQTMECRTPSDQLRALTVLGVSSDEQSHSVPCDDLLEQAK